ncbi:UBX domain-containing protein 11 isoform X2 [Hoplias malabaricus]|uniref:UBX domain-containing protein 11 isoform X2 n=1 Tax=Hoplias malabaricus TaxID=27720 RepID=UPI0034633331
MSSALSTLKKNRRAPLIPGETHRERQFYKEGAHTGRPPSDFELMSSMVQRLGQLERRVKAQELDINGKARRIAALEEKLQLLQEKTRGGKQDEEGLAEKCRRLQNQVQEMEKFLNDYGLIWVGDAKDPEAAEKSDSGRTIWQPDVSQLRNFSMNFDLVLQSVKDLNILAGEGESFVRSVPGGAKLIQQEAIPLCLYKNGIVMFQGPFRSYQDPSTQRCMRDLMDGYFPSELQKRFPDGVVFQVTDRREEEFRVRRTTVFSGRGQTVGGSEEEVQDHREEDTSTHTLLNHSQSQSTGQRLSMEQFLNKLPQSVVRGGKVINIRSSLKALLQGCAEAGSDSVAVIETPALHALRESVCVCVCLF